MASTIARLAVHVGVDIDDFKAKMALLKKELAAIGKSLEETGQKWRKFGNDANKAFATALALGPSLVPLLATLTAAVGGLGAAFAAVGAGIGAFAAIAIPALKNIFDASKNIDKINQKLANASTEKERAKALKELNAAYGSLNAKEREALKALEDFKSFWSGFVKSLQNPVLDIFIKGLNTLKTTLNSLKPVFAASISAFSDLFNGMNKAVKGQEIKSFIDWLAKNVGPAIRSFGTAFGNVMRGIMNLIMAFGPVSQNMENGLVRLTQRFAEWTAGLSKSQGFKDFIAYVQANAPKLMSILGQLADIIIKLIQAMAPIAPTVLDIVNSLLQLINQFLSLHPTMGTIIVVGSQLLGIFRLLSGPLGSIISLVSKLGPVFTALSPILSAFASKALQMLVNGFMRVVSALNVLRLAALSNPFILIIAAVVALVAIIVLNWDKIKVYLLNAWNWIKAKAAAIWNGIKSFFANIWNGIKSVTSSVWNGIKAFIGSIWSGIKSVVTSAINGVKSTITSIWNGIKSITSNTWNTIKSLVKSGITGAWNTIKGFAGSFLSAGKGLLDALISGIKSGFHKAVAAVKEGLATIRSYLPFSPAKEGPLSDLDKSGESFFPTFATGMRKGLGPSLKTFEKGIASFVPPVPSVNTEPTTVSGGNITINNHFHIANAYMNSPENIRQTAEKLNRLQQIENRAAGVRVFGT